MGFLCLNKRFYQEIKLEFKVEILSNIILAKWPIKESFPFKLVCNFSEIPKNSKFHFFAYQNPLIYRNKFKIGKYFYLLLKKELFHLKTHNFFFMLVEIKE